jgi:uncharacterized protein YjiS (DUF1127 family)
MQRVDRHPFADGYAIRLPSLARLRAMIALWRRRWRTRRQLATLNARALADIGISDAQRRSECRRPFWE